MCKMYEMKINNLLVYVEILSLCRKEILFKRSFNNISGNRGLLFSQINFHQTHFGDPWHGGILSGSLCLGVMS